MGFKATVTTHTQFPIARVEPRVFGGFLEHMGRAVYEGVYDPESERADEDGFRTDVLNALRQLDLTVMRYPGGNFASGYHWQDGVGPREGRPTVRELAWQSIEPNDFGTDEFLALCRKMDWEPMITVNLGTGTPEEARNWVEYCNCPAGTKYADMRVENGHPEPYGVKLWCLGNEMDGPWQLGHVPADQYAIRAQQAAKMMKDVDGSIELVACGSSGVGLNTYLEWDRQVLETVGDLADYVSLHRYVGNRDDDTVDYLAITNAIDRQIEEVGAVARYVQGRRKAEKPVYLSFDEWNVWYKNRQMDGEGKFAPHLIEEIYNLEDALVVAGFLHSFIRHADVVKIANLAQIVNVIAPLQTRGDELLVQTIFYPLAMFTRCKGGTALQAAVEGPSTVGRKHGAVSTIDASVIEKGQALYVFLTNRSVDEEAEVAFDLADGELGSVGDAQLLTGPDAKSANTFEKPDVVSVEAFEGVEIEDGSAHLTMPPLSLVALTLGLA